MTSSIEKPTTTKANSMSHSYPAHGDYLGDRHPKPDCSDRSDTIIGETFLFYKDSDQLLIRENTHLLALLPILKAMDTIEVHWYASPEGSKGRENSYNLNLSCHRANTLASLLIRNDITKNKIKTFNHGGTKAFGAIENNRSVVIPINLQNFSPALIIYNFVYLQ